VGCLGRRRSRGCQRHWRGAAVAAAEGVLLRRKPAAGCCSLLCEEAQRCVCACLGAVRVCVGMESVRGCSACAGWV
jgi:hypothetical protein